MYRIPRLIVAALLLAAWCPATRAAKPAPEIRPVSPGDVRAVGPRATFAGTPACIGGVQGPAVFSVNYILPPHDVYYSYIRCDACAPDSQRVGDIHIALQFPVPCSLPATVSFVASTGDTLCPEPDTLAALTVPVGFVLSASQPGDYDFALSLPQSGSITGNAFLRVDFVADGADCSTSATRPRLLTTGTCASCRSWNDSVAGRQDLCHVLLPGQPIQYVAFESCAVPTRRATWGTLKLVYR